MAIRYISRNGSVTAINTFTLLTLDSGATALPSERMPTTATRIVQISVTFGGHTPDTTLCGGDFLVRLTGNAVKDTEAAIPVYGVSMAVNTAGASGCIVGPLVKEVDIPLRPNELLNIGFEQLGGVIFGASGFEAHVVVGVEY